MVWHGNATTRYGKDGCKIDYIATHCYSCTPSKTLAYLKEIYDRYGKKVWLTEFSCGDHVSTTLFVVICSYNGK